MAKVSDLISGDGGVRALLNDTDSTNGYRYSDDDLVQYCNDALLTLSLLRPDLFSSIGDITCTAATTLQSAPTGAIRILDIFQVKAGRVVTEISRGALDRYNSSWHNDTAAAAQHWMRHDRDPSKFFIYPKAPADQTLVGQWAAPPTALTSDGTIPVPASYIPAIKDYMVFAAESVNEEFARECRAAAFS